MNWQRVAETMADLAGWYAFALFVVAFGPAVIKAGAMMGWW